LLGTRRARVALTLAALATTSAPARAAEVVWLPGSARTIARATSASRDIPLLELAYGPRAQASVGLEPGFLAVVTSQWTVHVGGYAMVALENGVSKIAFPPSETWRGLVGFSVSASADALARRWFGRDASLEFSLVLGHESDHFSGHDTPVQLPGDLPNVTGDFVAPDVALRAPLGRFLVTARLSDRVYVRGALVDAPSADLGFRLRVHPIVQPTLALYGEQILPRDGAMHSGFFGRVLAGVGFVGRLGEVTPFFSVDAGNGKGVLVARREARISGGIRYAPF
jgi:hypothetical protein